MALLLEEEEEAARAHAVADGLPAAYRSRWRRTGMLRAVTPVDPRRADRALWQLVYE